jgi:hypothetical protein
MNPKKIYKDPQVSRMYGLLSELKNKPLTKSLGPFLLGETIQNNQKTDFLYRFWPFRGQIGQMDQMDPKGYTKGYQMDPKWYTKVASGRDVWPNV